MRSPPQEADLLERELPDPGMVPIQVSETGEQMMVDTHGFLLALLPASPPNATRSFAHTLRCQ
jgi:hypothetical protein